jgi:hypothetical protein
MKSVVSEDSATTILLSNEAWAIIGRFGNDPITINKPQMLISANLRQWVILFSKLSQVSGVRCKKVSGVGCQVSGFRGHRAWRMGLKICYANSVIIRRRYALCSLP